MAPIAQAHAAQIPLNGREARELPSSHPRGVRSGRLTVAHKAYVTYLGTLGFVVERTGPTTRSGDYLITPVRYGRPGDWSYAITLMQVKDGKIVYHTGWTVPAPGS